MTMKNKLHISLILTFCCVITSSLSSCGGNNNSNATNSDSSPMNQISEEKASNMETEQTEVYDPVEQFKKVIENSKKRIEDGGVYDPDDDFAGLGARTITNVKILNTQYDVQKTDSLVSPYIGLIEHEVVSVTEFENKKENSISKTICRTHYSYQDNQWIMKKRESYLPALSSEWMDLDDQEPKTLSFF